MLQTSLSRNPSWNSPVSAKRISSRLLFLLSRKRATGHEGTAAISIHFCACLPFQISLVIMWLTLHLPGRGESLQVSGVQQLAEELLMSQLHQSHTAIEPECQGQMNKDK